MRPPILVLALSVLAAPVVSAQEVELRDGGSVTIRSGGTHAVLACGLSYTTEEDFAWLQHRGTGFTDLYLWVEGADDTMLLVMDPDENIHCDDDGHGDLQPLVRIPRSKSGLYGIFVGLHTEGTRGTATVHASISMPTALAGRTPAATSAPVTLNAAAAVGDRVLFFAQELTLDAMSDGWRERRDVWIAQVNAVRTPAQLAQAVLELEASMGWQAVDETWSGRRDRWVADLGAADDVGDVAQAMLALEEATTWDAVSEQWAGVREDWVAQMRRIADR